MIKIRGIWAGKRWEERQADLAFQEPQALASYMGACLPGEECAHLGPSQRQDESPVRKQTPPEGRTDQGMMVTVAMRPQGGGELADQPPVGAARRSGQEGGGGSLLLSGCALGICPHLLL